ncbi:serine hydrolase domain-containing protein [Longispora urticae]
MTLDVGWLADRLADACQRDGVPGAACSVLDESGTHDVAYGTAGAGGAEVRPDTPFGIASVSKAVTATLFLRMLANGALSPETLLGQLCPTFEGPAAAIPVRRLLSHTSGLAGDHFAAPAWSGDPFGAYSRELLALGIDDYPDDGICSYGNGAYVALAHVVEHRLGQRYDDLVRASSLFPARPDDAARGHRRTGPTARVPWDRASLPTCLLPAGGLFASAPALARFGHATLCDPATRLSEPLRAAALRPHSRVPHRRTVVEGWGLGWMVYAGYAGRVVGHDGQGDGYSAHLRIAPGAGVTVAVTTNRYEAGPTIGRVIADVFSRYGIARSAAPPSPVATEREPHRIVGRYRRHGVTCDVTTEGDGLWIAETTDAALVPFVGGSASRGPLDAETDGTFTWVRGGSRTVVAFPVGSQVPTMYMNDRRLRRIGDPPRRSEGT